jgi:hypothetical protein
VEKRREIELDMVDNIRLLDTSISSGDTECLQDLEVEEIGLNLV